MSSLLACSQTEAASKTGALHLLIHDLSQECITSMCILLALSMKNLPPIAYTAKKLGKEACGMRTLSHHSLLECRLLVLNAPMQQQQTGAVSIYMQSRDSMTMNERA